MEKRQNILAIGLVLVLVFGFVGFLAYKGSQNQFKNPEAPIVGNLQTKILKNSDSKPQIQVVVDADSATMTMDVASSGVREEKEGTVFPNVYQNTDAVYKKITNGIKEDIIINQKPAAQPIYNFSIHTDGLSIQYFENQYYFFDKDGYAKLMVPKPFMVDANGVRSESVTISITKSGKGYKSTVVPDFSWLSAPERKYPVKVDPSIVAPDKSIREMQDLRTISAKTYSLGDGKYATTSGLEAIHYQDGNGKWQEISNAIVPSNDPEYDFMNITNNFQVFFSTDGFGNKKAVKFQVGDSWMKFNLVGGSGSGELSEEEGNIFNFDQVYTNGTKTMDAKYTLSDTKLLEEIVLDQFQGYPELKQEIELHNAYLKESGGAINAYRKETNELLWIIPRPVMYEVNNTEVRNYGLHYELENVGEKLVVLSKVIDQEGKDWLSDPARNYPLVIDTTAGPNSPGTATDDSAVGTLVWSAPGDSLVSDSAFARNDYLGVEESTVYDNEIKLVKPGGTIGSENKSSGSEWNTTLTYYSYGSTTDTWGEELDAGDVNDSSFGVVISTRKYRSMSEMNYYSHYLKLTDFGFSIPESSSVGGIVVEYLRYIGAVTSYQYMGVDHARMTVYYTEGDGTTTSTTRFNNVKMNKINVSQ